MIVLCQTADVVPPGSLRVFNRVLEQVQPWLQAGRDGSHLVVVMLSIFCPPPQSDVRLRVDILQLFQKLVLSPGVMEGTP